MISTLDHEPAPAAWAVRDARLVVRRLLDIAGDVGERPVVVAVDGRSGSGKTTVSDRLASIVPGAAVVRTDDLAWEHSFFDWADLLGSHVLEPARRGRAVSYRPPAWERLDRDGAVAVPASTTLLLVEGVGASRADLAEHYDASVWVCADEDDRRSRGIERDTVLGRSPAEALEFWDTWEAQERPFLEADRPWERADVVTCGSPTLAGLAPGPDELVVVARA